jgi:hypothetical protein
MLKETIESVKNNNIFYNESLHSGQNIITICSLVAFGQILCRTIDIKHTKLIERDVLNPKKKKKRIRENFRHKRK